MIQESSLNHQETSVSSSEGKTPGWFVEKLKRCNGCTLREFRADALYWEMLRRLALDLPAGSARRVSREKMQRRQRRRTGTERHARRASTALPRPRKGRRREVSATIMPTSIQHAGELIVSVSLSSMRRFCARASAFAVRWADTPPKPAATSRSAGTPFEIRNLTTDVARGDDSSQLSGKRPIPDSLNVVRVAVHAQHPVDLRRDLLARSRRAGRKFRPSRPALPAFSRAPMERALRLEDKTSPTMRYFPDPTGFPSAGRRSPNGSG